ncbi:hypothetical protein [Bradyrhizobium icense]|uniref:hypothetical protein n=1 Tax=Bradyrhizobium icense TaxID=1274631 RepID=UPI0012EA6B36|nr:hypothetical protein [Bradyrhizobium icense]
MDDEIPRFGPPSGGFQLFGDELCTASALRGASACEVKGAPQLCVHTAAGVVNNIQLDL